MVRLTVVLSVPALVSVALTVRVDVPEAVGVPLMAMLPLPPKHCYRQKSTVLVTIDWPYGCCRAGRCHYFPSTAPRH